MKYPIVNGRVETRSLEAHITDHCNLRCRQCCSLSPFLKAYYVAPDALNEDIALAKRVLQPQYFKLVGGEPLLHPQLLQVVRLAKKSQIAPIISITTNGHFVERLDDEVWSLIDHMTLSLYPSSPLEVETMALIENKTVKYGVTLNIKRQDVFQEMTLPQPRQDEQLTEAIYARCWLKRRCHMIRGGRFYMCTRPPHFDSFYGNETNFGQTDGLLLSNDSDFVYQLAAYLERPEALQSCKLCMGGDGSTFPHQQLTPQMVAARID